MNQNNRRSVIKRYALSFFLVLIIPMFSICAFFVVNLNNMLREKTLADNKLQMSLITGNLNRQINNIVTCAHRLSTSDNIYRYRLSQPAIYGSSIINDLRTNVLSSTFTSDIYLFSTSMPYAYSSYSTYSMDRFVTRITEDTLDIDEYTAFLDNIEAGKPTAVYQQNVILLYFCFPVSDSSSDMYVVFEISHSMLREYIRSFSLPSQLLFSIDAITAANDTYPATIYKSQPSGEICNELTGFLCDSQLEWNTQTVIDAKTSQGKYTILTDYETILGWNYYYAIPEDNIINNISEFQIKMYTVILIVVSVGNILVLVFTYANYRPIRNLRSNLERLVSEGNGKQGLSGNEFQAIEQIAVNLHSSVKELSHLAGINKIALKQFIILRLIQGMITDYNTIKSSLAQLGLFIEDGYFFVATMYVSEDTPQYDQCTAFIEEYGSADVQTIYAVHGSEKGQIIIIVSALHDDISAYAPFLNQLHKSFTDHFATRATMGVGLVYPELTQLSISYMQATMAYDFRQIQGYNQVLIFDSQDYSISMDTKYRNLLNFLETAITSCKTDEVKSTLHYFVDFMNKESLSLYNARYICQNIIQIAATAFYSFPYPVVTDFSMNYNLDKIVHIETLDDLAAFLDEVSEDVCKNINSYLLFNSTQKNTAPCKQDIVAEMIAYIDENISSNQLSIVSTAEHFGLSASYVSRIFKEIKDMTILEYVNDKKIELARLLLTTTDKNIESIVTELGYFDTSSFIRKFKKIVGVTPGEFRKHSSTGSPD